jgi:hypothetical protein
VAITCVSQRKPSENSGRIERSISRQVRISFSDGRPSRLKKPPGNLAGGESFFQIIDGEREKISVEL